MFLLDQMRMRDSMAVVGCAPKCSVSMAVVRVVFKKMVSAWL
jgi:hypothetical protein